MLSDEDQIRALVQTWQSASKAGDIDTLLGLMTDDVVFLVPGRPPMHKAEFATLSQVPAGSPRPKFESTSEIQGNFPYCCFCSAFPRPSPLCSSGSSSEPVAPCPKASWRLLPSAKRERLAVDSSRRLTVRLNSNVRPRTWNDGACYGILRHSRWLRHRATAGELIRYAARSNAEAG